MSTMPSIDALGDPIVMGQSYGYVNEGSGITRVVVGIADSVTKTGKISLVVVDVKYYVYGSPSARDREDPATKVSVKGCMLFPVQKKV
jgi:hypothetical protein